MTCILSLDDEPEMLRLLHLMFSVCGYEHLRTTSSDEALSVMRQQPIDLFTQDRMRPDMHGLEVYRFMKADEDLKHIPVLFVSAGRRPGFADECRTKYGDEYLLKPFGPHELLTCVEVTLNRHGKHLPTEEERAAVYTKVRAELAKEFRWKLAEVDAHYERMTNTLEELRQR